MKDYYAVLGVSRDAAPGVVKIAYEGRLKKAARLSGAERAAEEKLLKEAFTILSNPAKREHFDARMMEVDANLAGSGSNTPIIVGVIVVMLTVAGVGFFLSERSKDKARLEAQQRKAAERAAARKMATQKETLEEAEGKPK